jgi:hypothetical protein
MQLETTDAWRSAFPDAHVGIVVVDGLKYRTYAPAGIDPHDVQRHLDEIAGYVSLASPGAIVSQVEII